MKHRIIAIVMTVVLLFVLASPVLGGGDKIRGDKGDGGVAQYQKSEYPYERRP